MEDTSYQWFDQIFWSNLVSTSFVDVRKNYIFFSCQDFGNFIVLGFSILILNWFLYHIWGFCIHNVQEYYTPLQVFELVTCSIYKWLGPNILSKSMLGQCNSWCGNHRRKKLQVRFCLQKPQLRNVLKNKIFCWIHMWPQSKLLTVKLVQASDDFPYPTLLKWYRCRIHQNH